MMLLLIRPVTSTVSQGRSNNHKSLSCSRTRETDKSYTVGTTNFVLRFADSRIMDSRPLPVKWPRSVSRESTTWHRAAYL